ncbi:MAG TPA: hypothetical protein VH988_26065 [Thermoanaerobaculia bacterium]|nr:hypothetical protein [Thermoanaerobaculia bacterium]
MEIVPGEMVVDFVLTRKSAEPAPAAKGWELAADDDPAAKAEVTGTFRGLDPGEVAHGFGVEEPARRLVVAGAPVDDLEIRIPAATNLAGEVRGLLPGEIPWVAIEGPGGTSYSIADPSGSFTATLYPGDWIVTIRVDRLSGSEVVSSNRIAVHEGDAEVPLQIRVQEETPP